MDIISSQTSKITLNLKCSVRIAPAKLRLLRKALLAGMVECSQFALKNGKRHGLGLKRVDHLELTVTLCGMHKIRSLNRQWRHKDYATDVLSFPVHDELRGNQFPLPPNLELGDLFICHQVAQRQSVEYQVSWEQEIVHLFIHGFLHLLGFDHELSEAEEKLMQKYEQALVKKSYQRLGWEK